MQEKYGFVYIWFDRKYKRYYIGSHWGTENDGYVCSSQWMLRAYLYRPNDFKRRILSNNINDRFNLRKIEQYWLNFIKEDEIKPLNSNPRYYNLNIKTSEYWYDKEQTLKSIGEKISASKMGKKPNWIDPETRGNNISKSKKIKIAERGGFSEDHKNKIALANTGKKQSEETIRKKSEALKESWANGTRKRKEKRTIQKVKFSIEMVDGKILEIDDLKSFAREINAPYVTLSKASQENSGSKKYKIQKIERIYYDKVI